MAENQKSHPGTFLFAAKHELAGILSFRMPDHPTVFLIGGPMRPSFYSGAAVARLRGQSGLLITDFKSGDMGYLAPYFDKMTLLAEVPLLWGGRVADRYRVFLCQGYRGGIFVEGDGYHGAVDKP